MVSTDSEWVDSVSKSTGDTNRIKYVFETWNERLQSLLDSVSGLDQERIFSSVLRRICLFKTRHAGSAGRKLSSFRTQRWTMISIIGVGGKRYPQMPGCCTGCAI